MVITLVDRGCGGSSSRGMMIGITLRECVSLSISETYNPPPTDFPIREWVGRRIEQVGAKTDDLS